MTKRETIVHVVTTSFDNLSTVSADMARGFAALNDELQGLLKKMEEGMSPDELARYRRKWRNYRRYTRRYERGKR